MAETLVRRRALSVSWAPIGLSLPLLVVDAAADDGRLEIVAELGRLVDIIVLVGAWAMETLRV
jgi:hypothetical protein